MHGEYTKTKDGLNIYFDPSTIETIDRAVFSYVTELNLATGTNKGFKKVPVIWGSAERSFQSKKGQEVRDGQGMLKLPIITVERKSIEKDFNKRGVFHGNVPAVNDEQGGSLNLRRVLYQEKTRNFATADSQRITGQLNYPRRNKKVVYRTVSVPMPVNISVKYEIRIRTEYQQQMNDILTPFITKPGTINYISLREKEHKYEGFIEQQFSVKDNITDFSSEERKFETTIGLNVIGYLISEGVNQERPYFAVRENIVEVKIPRERISLAEIPEHEKGALYGLGAGAFGRGASGTAVTTGNFAQVLSQNMIFNENLTAVNNKSYRTSSAIRTNSEVVYLNGMIQSRGALNGEYAVSNNNTIVFNDAQLSSDIVTITYILG
jgi:hypothetical protein